jgi:predicted XRE-type DNA-binding protein
VVTASSGNVFADLGLPNVEELGTKVRLATSLNAILAARKLTQAEAERLLGVNPAEGFGAEGVQTGGVFGGAADALHYGPGA